MYCYCAFYNCLSVEFSIYPRSNRYLVDNIFYCPVAAICERLFLSVDFQREKVIIGSIIQLQIIGPQILGC